MSPTLRTFGSRQSTAASTGVRSAGGILLIWAIVISVFTCHLSLARAIDEGARPMATAGFDAITPDTVRPLIAKLSADEFEGRGAGYQGEKRAADYVAAEFKKLGLAPVGDGAGKHRSYFQEFRFNPRYPDVPWEMLTSRNILGFLEGSDPVLKQEIVVIGAHYDGQGRIGQADPMRFYPKDPAITQNHPIWNSANDNLTGVAAVLASARAIRSGRIKPKRSIVFVAFGCEEHGMSGSIAYVTNPPFPLARHVAMINFEKLGRAPDKLLSASAILSSPDWPGVLAAATSLAGTKVNASVPFVIPDSDHYPFAAVGVPAVVFFVPTRDDTHLPTDTAEKIDYARVAEFARYGLTVLVEVANRPSRPVYTTALGRDPGMIAHLVSDQEADAAGLKPPASGLKVTGVIPGGAASRAGLQPGDLIISGGGMTFRRDTSLESLQKMQLEIVNGQRGDHLPVTLLRGGQQLEFAIDLPSPHAATTKTP